MQLNNEDHILNNNISANTIISSIRRLEKIEKNASLTSSQRPLNNTIEQNSKEKKDTEQRLSYPIITSQASMLPSFNTPSNLINHKLLSNALGKAPKLSKQYPVQVDSCIKAQPHSDSQSISQTNRRKKHSQTVMLTNNKKSLKARNSIFRRANGANKLLQKSTSNLNTDTVKLIEQTYNKSQTRHVMSIKIIDIVLASIVAGNIILSIAENELHYKETVLYFDGLINNSESKEYSRSMLHLLAHRTITTKENAIRWINIILIIIMWIFNTVHYILQMIKMRREGILAANEGMWASGLLKYFLFETFIISWFNPPNTNFFFVGSMDIYDYAFSLGSIICIITMFKSYLIIRVYTYISKWTTETSKRICIKNSVNPGVHFALKADLKHRPYSMLTLIFGSAILCFALALRAFEYFTVSQGDNDLFFVKGLRGDNNHLKDIVNSVWMTIVTMTTVGYGDYVPKENYGRVICIISCIVGLLLVSIIVVSLEMITDFSEEEKKAYSIIKKINADQNVILKATEVIVALAILRVRSMTKKDKLSERFVYIMKLKQSITSFKDDFRLAKAMDLPLDQTLNIIQKRIQEKYAGLSERIVKLEFLKDSVDNVNTSQKYCLKVMAEVNKRQKRLGDFLVDLNNKQLKNSSLGNGKRSYEKNNLSTINSKSKPSNAISDVLEHNSMSSGFLIKKADSSFGNECQFQL